jgi:hypothetical protein
MNFWIYSTLRGIAIIKGDGMSYRWFPPLACSIVIEDAPLSPLSSLYRYSLSFSLSISKTKIHIDYLKLQKVYIYKNLEQKKARDERFFFGT